MARQGRDVPTRDWVYGGVVTPSAQLHVPEDGGVSYLHMNPPAVLNKYALMRIAAKKSCAALRFGFVIEFSQKCPYMSHAQIRPRQGVENW